MQRDFWLERWSNQEIGFHQAEVNRWLRKLWPTLDIPEGSAVFVPLCGKSIDMAWLAKRGHRVIGVEFAEAAVRAFYQEAGSPYRVERLRHVQLFTGSGVTIFCGDFMDLTVLHLRSVAAVYDRGGLVALPPRMRAHYADHLQRIIAEGCQVLLIALEYPQARVPGPPHSVEQAEVKSLFGQRCRIERLHSAPTRELPPRFAEAGVLEAVEVVYRIVKKS